MTEAPHSVLVSKEDMMRYHDPVRIQGYCQSCDKYGAFWSCPPFETAPLSRFPPWTHAVLVTQKTWVEPGSTKDGLLATFLAARVHFGAFIMQRESRVEACTALIAGHCSGCDHCTRPQGNPCCRPSQMRHSLEAVGFDVTGLSEGLAGQKLHWPKTGLPDYLITVGALLCPSQTQATTLHRQIPG